AGALCIFGKPPKFVYAFEAPMVSIDSILGDVLKAHGVQVIITHNGHDIVPCVPDVLGPWHQPVIPLELCQTEYPWPKISFDPVANVEDHLIENVIKTINSDT
ncbi:MAG: hypothetical protein M0Z78_06175, partial [Betaproteobacteria bacterium]|nr:hypothetical protein [Betaproteobacteria bacterium]